MHKTIYLFAIFIFFLNSIPAPANSRRMRFPSFQCPTGNCESTGSSNNGLNFTPLINTPTERTIAVNGIAVPKNAIGYQFINGNLQWVFSNEDSPEPSFINEAPGKIPSESNHAKPAEKNNSEPFRPAGDGPRALVRANTKGNPGFQYSVKGPGFSENCQATLISAKNGQCFAATAAHCLEDGAARSGANFDQNGLDNRACHEDIRKRGIKWGRATIGTADFGDVEAILYINPEHAGGSKSEDSAVFGFSCPKGAGEVPVIEISDRPLQNKEPVVYGKVMGGKAGLYNGYVFREPGIVGINYRSIGEAQESVIQHEDVKIQQGDSGGAFFRKNSSNQLELVGLLSTGDDTNRNWPLGNYATNRSLDFVRCIKAKFESGSIENEKKAVTTPTGNPTASSTTTDHSPEKELVLESPKTDSKELVELKRFIKENNRGVTVKEEDTGVFNFCTASTCYPPQKGFERAQSFLTNLKEKLIATEDKSDEKQEPIPKNPTQLKSPTLPTIDKAGTAYSVTDLKFLSQIVLRNSANRINTKVMYGATNCGPCQLRKPGFLSEAKTAPTNVRYYLFEIPNYNSGIQSMQIPGTNITIGNISSFPTEATY
ncbi:MAG: trypsin-like serine protease [Bdellovibrionales bacterium]|nr:trypsin-like serine protease [Bdellovibrionales bacterium]